MNEQAPDNPSRLDTATRLAFERTRIAYERTMMAWIRTATSLVTFGFAVYKFFEFDIKYAAARPMRMKLRGFGLTLIVIGLLSLLLGAVEQGRDLRALR
jgi:putative membrane protein